MRILHVAAYYAPAFVYGGPPRSIHALCRALTEQGVDVQVFTTDANGAGSLPPAVTAATELEGVPVRYFTRTWPASPIGSRALTTALRQGIDAYDVVHVHGLWNRVAWAAAREASRAGVPYVLSPRGMLEPAARAHRAWRKRAAWALADRHLVTRASLLHATSEAERDTLQALAIDVPIAMIPNGIAIEPPLPRAAAWQPSVLFIGRIHPIKRLDLLIDAFASVRERRPDVRLVIAGPDEAGLKPALMARAGRHAAAITWEGAVDDGRRRQLLAEASALAMCSDTESFGMSVLEAMADAVPVVVTKTCPWPDVERHCAGLWVDQTVGAIAAALDRLLADPSAARAMGERGSALAASLYGWSSIAATFVDRYRALASFPASATLQVTA
jgi:glycosyltransferase involved in cell wall biosynthesis